MSKPVRLLHVDDDADFTDLAKTFLERENEQFAVETATSVGDGVDRLSNGEFDCIISDYEMVGRNGIEFLDTVRATYPDLPFILFTGKGSEEIASEAISAGVTDYLQKGVGTEQYELLANRVENAVAQHRAELEVETTEQRYRHLIEESTDVITVLDGDGTFEYLSPAAGRVLGYTAEEMVGENAFTYVHPDDRERVVEEFAEQVSDPDKRVTSEFRFFHADGFWKWVEVRGRNLLDTATVDGIVVYARDIADRKERERELEKYETIVENTDDGIYVFDADGRYKFVNRRVADVSGIPKDDWIDRHVSIHTELGTLTQREVAAVEEAIDAIVDGDADEVSIEIAPELPDGVRALELRFMPLPTETASDLVVSFSRDITERKEHERELERKNDRLEKFASVVSHDLRNPLNVAEGRLEMAREDCDSGHLEDVAGAHQRMRTLVDDLLTLAREGETAMDVENIALSEVVERCWQNIETGEVKLVNDAETIISADRNRLQQLLENLVRNAVDHCGAGVTVTVGDSAAGFYVADDGPGVPDGEAVFEAGYSTAEEGTGFGLTIVQNIADAHGWEVTVTESEAGGARFEIAGVETELP